MQIKTRLKQGFIITDKGIHYKLTTKELIHKLKNGLKIDISEKYRYVVTSNNGDYYGVTDLVDLVEEYYSYTDLQLIKSMGISISKIDLDKIKESRYSIIKSKYNLLGVDIEVKQGVIHIGRHYDTQTTVDLSELPDNLNKNCFNYTPKTSHLTHLTVIFNIGTRFSDLGRINYKNKYVFNTFKLSQDCKNILFYKLLSDNNDLLHFSNIVVDTPKVLYLYYYYYNYILNKNRDIKMKTHDLRKDVLQNMVLETKNNILTNKTFNIIKRPTIEQKELAYIDNISFIDLIYKYTDISFVLTLGVVLMLFPESNILNNYKRHILEKL